MMKRVPDRQDGPARPPRSGAAPGRAPGGPPAAGPVAAQQPQRRGPHNPPHPRAMRSTSPEEPRRERKPWRRKPERSGEFERAPEPAPFAPAEATEPNEFSDETLLVIEDLDNGRDYYMAVVDQFPVGDRDYIVFTHYTQDTGDHREPDFVLMRVLPGDDGQQYYASIRDKEELDIVFEKFFERMQGDLLGEA